MIFSALGVIHRPLLLLVLVVCPLSPGTSSTTLVVIVDSIVSWRGWCWHCRRIALLSDNDDGDLPFPLFFFQTDKRSQLILQGTVPYFSTFLHETKLTSPMNEMGIKT